MARLEEGHFRWVDTLLLPRLQCRGLLSSPNPASSPTEASLIAAAQTRSLDAHSTACLCSPQSLAL